MEKNTKKNNVNNILVIILSFLLLVSIGITIWAVFFRKPVPADPGFNPDYPPQETEPNQKPIQGDQGQETLPVPNGGGAINLTYGTNVVIDLSEEKASFYFANPSKSTQDMVMTLVVNDTVVMISKRITPGNKLSTLGLKSGVADGLQAGTYNAKYVVYLYDCQTGEKAIVNAEGEVTVTVIP